MTFWKPSARPTWADVRAHDRQIAAEPDIAEARLQAAHIAPDLGADIGVHHRGRDALEFAIFAQDFVRERQIGVGQQGADDLAGDTLVLGIGIGVQEADRDRFHARIGQRAARILDAGALERRMNLAGGEHAFLGLQGETAGHQRTMLVEQKIIGLGPIAAADDVNVAGAARHDQASGSALALDQRVDGDGRAVNELVDGLKPALVQAIDDALNQVGRRGQALGLHECARRLLEADEIRERSADIDRNDEHADPPRRPVELRSRGFTQPARQRGFGLIGCKPFGYKSIDPSRRP